MKTLNIIPAFKDTFNFAFKNIPSVFGCAILWLLTVWIPYVNIGTTIAMVNLPLELANGKVISPLSIFSAKYRKKMGDYFIYTSLTASAFLCALCFMVIPVFVLAIAWSMGLFVMIEWDKNPLEALRISNNITYGSKWKICALNAAIFLATSVITLIILQVLYEIEMPTLSVIVCIILLTFFVGLSLSANAAIWRQLRENKTICE